MNIKLTYKTLYGNERFYPSCKNSEVIAYMGKFKSFTREQVQKMREAGWKLDIEGFVPTL